MTEDEYDALMKKSLTSAIYWQGVTATPDEARQAKEWLRATLSRINTDFRVKKAQWVATAATYSLGSHRYREELARYKSWEAKALRFQGLVAARFSELAPKVPAPGKSLAPKPLKPPKPPALERAHAHAEYMEKERQHLFRSLVAISRAVEAFEGGETSVRELAGKLDTLTVPYQGDSGKTIRTILFEIKDTWVERP